MKVTKREFSFFEILHIATRQWKLYYGNIVVGRKKRGKEILVWNLAFKDKFGDPAKCRTLNILEVLFGLVLV